MGSSDHASSPSTRVAMSRWHRVATKAVRVERARDEWRQFTAVKVAFLLQLKEAADAAALGRQDVWKAQLKDFVQVR